MAGDAFVHDVVLGVAAWPGNGACIEHLVAGLEERHGMTNRLDHADGIPTEDAGSLCCRPGAHFHVHGIHRDGTHLDPQVAGAGRRFGQVLFMQRMWIFNRQPVLCIDDGFHVMTPVIGWNKATVMA